MYYISNHHVPAKFIYVKSHAISYCNCITKVADLHISPYETKEVNAAKASYAQGRLKVQIIHVENRNDHDCAICACIIYSVYEPSYMYLHIYAMIV